ncbi:MAG TPA: MarR family transcriptional regulator [Caproiciproducens sp.]|nr:MarR family transcriptional regulator [Caproiciproducens sp.]
MDAQKREIGFEIRTLSNLIRHYFHDHISELKEITGMQGWIIGYIYNHGESQNTFQRDLEKEFRIRRSTVTGILQLMEKNGLITRESVDYDARLKKLKLTPKAVEIHEKVLEEIVKTENRLRKGLSDEEIEEFFSIIGKLKDNME